MGLLILIFAGVVAAQAAAEPPAQAPAAAADPPAKAEAAAKPERAKLVCVVESQIGSRTKRRICVSQEELNRREDRDQQMRSMPVTKPPSGPPAFKPGA